MFDPRIPGRGNADCCSRRMTNNDVSNTPELSGGGGGTQSVPSRISVVLVDEANAGGTPEWECPCEDQYMRPLAGTTKPSSGTVYDGGIRSPCEGRALFPSDVAGRLFPVDVADTPTLSVGGPRSVPSRISVVFFLLYKLYLFNEDYTRLKKH